LEKGAQQIMNLNWRKIGFAVLLLALWQGLFLLRIWPEFLFPGPAEVWQKLIHGFSNGSYFSGIAVSMARLSAGYVISLVLGISLGLLVGCIKWLDETLGALLLALQTLPSICWLPLALLWFGLNEKAILFMVVIGAVMSISLAAEDGVRSVPPLFLKAARNMGARGWALYTQVIFPAALPSIVTGMKLGWSFAWRALMAAELLYSSVGLGHLLTMGRELNDIGEVIAVMLVIVVLGLLVDKLVFAPIEKAVRVRWGTA
jgi:NitT/TauT family transport system permease protein